MVTTQDEKGSTKAQHEAALTASDQLLIQQEVRRIISRYLGGLAILLGLFTVFGVAGIYGVISQSLTSTLSTRIDTKLATLDATLAAKLVALDGRIEKYQDDVETTARNAFKTAQKFESNSEKASRESLERNKTTIETIKNEAAARIGDLVNKEFKELEKRIGETEKSRQILLAKIGASESQLTESKRVLAKFEEDVKKAADDGANGIAANPVLQKAVADRIQTESSDRMAKLEKGLKAVPHPGPNPEPHGRHSSQDERRQRHEGRQRWTNL